MSQNKTNGTRYNRSDIGSGDFLLFRSDCGLSFDKVI